MRVSVVGDVEGVGSGDRPWAAVTEVVWHALGETVFIMWGRPNENKWTATRGKWETHDRKAVRPVGEAPR